MSNPEGDLKGMSRRHRATLLGIAAAVILAVIAILVLAPWQDPDEPPAAESPADAAETVGLPEQALEPGEVPERAEAAPPGDVSTEPPGDGDADGR